MPGETLFWIVFSVLIVGSLLLDLLVFHRGAKTVSLRSAALTTAFWVSLGLGFGGLVWLWRGPTAAGEYLAGYLIEQSLSVDNMFVFAMVFAYFGVPAAYQRRVLLWGVLGALFFRAIFIAVGAALLHNFHWMIYLFGAFLLFTGLKMALSRGGHSDPGKNPLLRLVRRLVPVTEQYHGERLLIREPGRWVATPLLAVLIAIESTDVIFAVDSIPAIFAVTSDPFLVYTSNAFAILGLRSLYFLLAGMMDRFHYLKLGLGFVLMFVGLKMVASDVYKVSIEASLLVIALTIGLSIAASLWRPRGLEPARALAPSDPLGQRGHAA